VLIDWCVIRGELLELRYMENLVDHSVVRELEVICYYPDAF
jgi:hypothetical protein